MNDILFDLNDQEIKEFGSWDYNLNYQKTYKNLVSEISTVRRELLTGNFTINRQKRLAYLITGLTQLRNGARIGEIYEAIKTFCIEPGKRIIQILVLKRKDNYYRKVVLPDEITKEDLNMISKVIDNHIDKKNFVSCISHYFKKYFSYSTHALRYCFISHMSALKVPAQLIAKITGHKTLELILHYTQRKMADLELFNLSKNYGFT